MQTQLEQPQLQRPQIVLREEVLTVVLSLQISFHQRQEKHKSRLSTIMVVQLGLSCL